MPELIYTSVSCGVNQYEGFYDNFEDDNAECTPEMAFKDLVAILKQSKLDSRREASTYEKASTGRYRCGMIIFSDVKDGPGHKFGEWLRNEFKELGPVGQAAKNPNTGNNIVSYVWALPFKAMMKHPLWKEVDLRKYKTGEERGDDYYNREEIW